MAGDGTCDCGGVVKHHGANWRYCTGCQEWANVHSGIVYAACDFHEIRNGI